MRRNELLSLFATFAFSFASAYPAYAAESAHPNDKEKQELFERETLSQAVAPIKSLADLERYLTIVPPKSNALNLLSPAARERFLTTLTFNEKGLTGFGFEDLQRELSQEQIAKVLALFGSESSAQYIKPAVDKKAWPGPKSKACYDIRHDRPQISGCSDPFEGGGFDGGPNGPFDGGGGYQGRPKIPVPFPPPDPIPGQLAPVRMENGDIYHMACESRATCGPSNNKVCRASC